MAGLDRLVVEGLRCMLSFPLPTLLGSGLISELMREVGQNGQNCLALTLDTCYLSEFFKEPLLRLHQRFIMLGIGPSVCLGHPAEKG